MIDSRLLPLAVIRANDEAVEGITRLQKLVFKTQKNILDEDEYEFEPHDYGPFSKELYNDVDSLGEDDYIRCEIKETPSGNPKKVYSITDEGEQILDRFSDTDFERKFDDIDELKEKDNDKPILELLSDIYAEYPEMAKNSKLDIV
ncbi:helix-turn-helix transcriptional regulator [Halostagnicola sp. A56]|uniref:helix-turn-helix transcriptional regulator n=1 Tax=Halostagnicola sp. A56 TaxID=1495067 RepID=UPI0012E1BAB9|nr:helix-turn-helix transcriptional regulator [Halostagnicola sp. A56]